MRKKLGLLFTFVLVLAVALGVMAGCNKKKEDDVTVEISKTTLELVTGDSRTLTATTSDGSDVVWTTSDSAVVTVGEKGKVTAEKAGTATVTATVKGGTASASCAVTVKDPVTVTVKDEQGNAVTDVEVDRNSNGVQLTATASDGSAVTQWSSSDEKIATVENGLIVGNKEGEATVYVRTASGGTAEISVTVIDTAEHEAIVEGSGSAAAGKWWYYANKESRSPEISTNEVREGVLTFEYGGGFIWTTGDLQIGLKKDSSAKLGWTVLKFKVNSSVAGKMDVFDTTVDIEEGENDVEVMYDQSEYSEMVYLRPQNSMAEGTLVIRIDSLVWEDYIVPTLDAPTLSLSGHEVTITDPNEKGVSQYIVGFFKDETRITSQEFKTATGTLDYQALDNGTYTLKVMAEGKPGFNSSDWSESGVEYTVNNEHVIYDLEDAYQNDGAVSSTRWYYLAVYPDWSRVDSASYEDGVVTFVASNLGWKFSSTHLYRNFGQFAAGTPVKLVINVNSNKAGHITICGTVVELEEGDNQFEIFTTQTAGKPTVTIMFGDSSKGEVAGSVDIDTGTPAEFKFEVVSAEDFTPEALATPSASYATEGNKLTVIDDDNEASAVASYQVGFFDTDGNLIGTASLKDDGTFSDLAIVNGTYSLKVRAIAATAEFTDSDWSEEITEYTVNNESTITDLINGGEAASYADPDVWYEWHDQNWNGATVTVSEGYSTSAGEVHFAFTIAGTNRDGQAAHLYKHYSNLIPGKAYTISLKINSTVACDILLNNETVTLTAGNNNVTVNFIHPVENPDWQGNPQGSSIRIFFNNSGSFVLSDVVITELTQTKLTAPSIAIAGDGTVTVTDANASGAASYVAGFFKSGSENPASTVAVVNGEKIDVSGVANGEYTVKIMAKADGLTYTDSDWSAAGVTYTVQKESNKINLNNSDVSGDPEKGNWFYYCPTQSADWNGWTTVNVTEATYDYDTGETSVTFNSNGTLAWGLQIIYQRPDDAVKTCTFTVQTDFNCTVEVVRNVNTKYTLTAGKAEQITISAAEFYMQVNLVGENFGGTITISDVQWN